MVAVVGGDQGSVTTQGRCSNFDSNSTKTNTAKYYRGSIVTVYWKGGNERENYSGKAGQLSDLNNLKTGYIGLARSDKSAERDVTRIKQDADRNVKPKEGIIVQGATVEATSAENAAQKVPASEMQNKSPATKKLGNKLPPEAEYDENVEINLSDSDSEAESNYDDEIDGSVNLVYRENKKPWPNAYLEEEKFRKILLECSEISFDEFELSALLLNSRAILSNEKNIASLKDRITTYIFALNDKEAKLDMQLKVSGEPPETGNEEKQKISERIKYLEHNIDVLDLAKYVLKKIKIMSDANPIVLDQKVANEIFNYTKQITDIAKFVDHALKF